MYKGKQWKRLIALGCAFVLFFNQANLFAKEGRTDVIALEDLEVDVPENESGQRILERLELNGSPEPLVMDLSDNVIEMEDFSTPKKQEDVDRTITESSKTFTVTYGSFPDNGSVMITGTNIKGTFKNGTLTLSGSGTLTGSPFYGYKDNIYTVVVTGNVVIGEYGLALLDKVKTVNLTGNASSIGEAAFAGCTALESFAMPENVTNIGNDLFYQCTALKSVELSTALTEIADGSFYECTALKNIVIPDSVSRIGNAAFYGCENLENVTFSDTYVDVGDYAFSFCNKIKTVEETLKLKNVGNEAFINTAIPAKISFSSEATMIGVAAFQGCHSLVEADFDNATLEVDDNAFFDCPNFGTMKNAPTFKAVGQAAFHQCAAIETVSFTEDAAVIGAGCFYECPNVKSVDFNQCAADIQHHAFSRCTSLEKVVISPNCKNIEKGAFVNCSKVSSLDFSGAEVIVDGYAFYECTGMKSISNEENVKEIREYAFFNTAIRDGDDFQAIEVIGEGAFAECDSMISVNLPDSLKIIEDYAFNQCDKLTTLKGGAEVTSIGELAFSWCTQLEKVNFPKASEVEKHAFNHCESLTSAVFGEKMEVLQTGVFAACYLLEKFSVPENVKKIEDSAFYQCGFLQEIELPKNLMEIETAAFCDCSSLTEISLPDTVKNIGESVFKGCTSLSTVRLSNKIEKIPAGTFSYCSALASVEMPDTLKEIGYAAFFGCEALNNLEFAPTLLTIGDYTFAECHFLKDVELPERVNSLGEYAFYNCKALTKIVIPVQVSSVPNYAFQGCEKLKEVQCKGKLSGIGVGAFSGCPILKNVYLYGGTPAFIGEKAFAEDGADIVIYSVSLDGSFTTPKWIGPDENTYTSVEIRPSTSGTFSNSLKWEFYNQSGDLVISGNGKMEDYESTYDVPWYDFVNEIYSVHIKDGVTSVGARAFAECPMLRSVYMEDSVSSCGAYAFSQCENLVYADLSDSMKTLDAYAFYNCTSLCDLVLPVSLNTIGEYAFFGCISVTGIAIPDSLKNLGEGAFYNCTGLHNIVLSTAIHKVEDFTFKGCTQLESVLLGMNTDEIGKYAFANCENLKYIGALNPSLEIQNYAFTGCTALETLHMVAGMPESVGYRAFYRVSDTFRIQYSMSGVNDKTYTTADGSILNCEKLEASVNGNCGTSMTWKYFANTGLLLISGSGEMKDYTENQTPWKDYKNEIRYVVMENGIKSVGANAFYQHTNLEKVMFPQTVTKIGESAFADCEKLQYVELPEGLTLLGENSFYCCNSLAGVHIPKNLKEIPNYAFALCEQLQILEIEDGIEKISYASFYACDSLKTVMLPDTLKEVEAWGFARCPKLVKIQADHVEKLGTYAFYGDEMLEEIPLGDELTEIPDYSFAGTGVKEVAFGNSVRTIGEGAFWGCEQLEAVNLGEVEEIESQAFMGTGLKTVLIPDDTHTVADYAFANCIRLKNIHVEESSSYYRSDSGVLYDFAGETLVQYPTGKQLATFIVPDGVTTIQNGAFYEAAFTYAVLPEGMDALGDGSFANSSVREVKFEGDSPTEIGVNAFYGTSAELRFIVSSEKEGWNDSQWQGPDGNDYDVEYEENCPYILRIAESVQDEESTEVTYKVYLTNNTDQVKTVTFWAAAYQKNEMIASQKISAELIQKMEYETEVCLSGAAKYPGEELQFKVFLLEENQSPMTAAASDICPYELSGDCKLQLNIGNINMREKSYVMKTTTVDAAMGEIEVVHPKMYVSMEFTAEEFEELLDHSAKNSISGVDFNIRYQYMVSESEKSYSTNLNISEYDQVFGFVPCDVTVDHEGYMQWPDDIPGLPMEYEEFSMLTTDRSALDLETEEFSELRMKSDASVVNEIAFTKGNEKLFTVRPTGLAVSTDDRLSEWRKDGNFVFTVPYDGTNLLFTVDAQSLTDALQDSEFAISQSEKTNRYEVSMLVKDAGNVSQVLCRVQISTDGIEVKDISVLELAETQTNEIDKSFHPLKYDESTEPTEDMVLSVANISPAKGANGMVTVRLEGTRMEAGAEVCLKKGETEIVAEKIYYFSHDKLYATFDLTAAENGTYHVILKQKAQTVTGPEFTVDSSLPKGTLTAKINVDKSAKVGNENKGSITYTNTGYTDVYAPVVLIDCGNIQFKGEEHVQFMDQDTVFVPNVEGLTGIVANGETAAYNFTYKLLDKKQFVMKVYNYSEIEENVADKILLNEESTGNDVLNYNMFELMGLRASDYAESIAKMACVQSSLGNEEIRIGKLREAFIPTASGSLTGSVLTGSTDLVSRELTLERYYYGDVLSQNSEGLWGNGWFSNYDITAELNKETDEQKNSIIIRGASGMAVYTLKEGVYTELAYGKSTAKVSDEGITVTYEDGTVYDFNKEGNLSSVADVYGNTVSLTYNEAKELVKIETNTGDSLIFNYEDGKPVSVSSSSTEDIVEYYYEGDVLVGVIDSYDKVSYQYRTDLIATKRPILTKITSSSGVSQIFEYDQLGRVICSENGEGKIFYEYCDGGMLKTTTATGDVYTSHFNSAGKTIRVVDSLGNVVNSQYSDMLMHIGNSVGIFEKETYEYDDQYNLSKVTDGNGNSVSYEYDSRNNMTKVTDRAGVATEYQRNGLGDIQRLLYADGKYEKFEYDSKGNIISAAKRDGSVTKFSYNEYSQMMKAVYETGETISYEYDKRGNVTKIDENGQVTSIVYDGRGDLKNISFPDGKYLIYNYDAYGRVTDITSEYGSSSVTEYYEYDEMGRLKNVLVGTIHMVSYEYYPDGSTKRQTNGNGTYTEYEYAGGMLTEIRNCKKDGTIISEFIYTYNELGKIATMKDQSGTWKYGYDKQGQLAKVTSPDGAVTVYTYDLSGNRTSVVTENSMKNYNSNKLNQYTSAGSAKLTYDVNGNLISSKDESGVTSYSYDYAERLIKVTEPDGKVTSYTYDAFGNRATVTVGGETTEYLNTPTGEGYPMISYSNDQMDTIYVQGNGLTSTLRVDLMDEDSDYLPTYYYMYNHLGSTTDIVDYDGNVVNHYEYNEEGKVISKTEGIDNLSTYVGKYGITEDGNGLYYARARYILTDTMSFTSMDPIGQNGDLNVYRYAGNDWVNYVDFTGNVLTPTSLGMRVGPVGSNMIRVQQTTRIQQVSRTQYIPRTQQIPRTTFEENIPTSNTTGTGVGSIWEMMRAAAGSFWKGLNRLIKTEKGKDWHPTNDNVMYLFEAQNYNSLQDGDLVASNFDGTMTGGAAFIGTDVLDILPADIYESTPTIVIEKMDVPSGLQMTKNAVIAYREKYGYDYMDSSGMIWSIVDGNLTLSYASQNDIMADLFAQLGRDFMDFLGRWF